MNININSTHHHAVSHLVFVMLFSPLQLPLLLSFFFFFWEFGDCWSRLPRTSKRYYQCAAAALVGHVNFCCCFPPPLSLPPPLCHSFSCSLTCHKPQVKKAKKTFSYFVRLSFCNNKTNNKCEETIYGKRKAFTEAKTVSNGDGDSDFYWSPVNGTSWLFWTLLNA